jgi:2,4-dienoyl-CoA reductase-like NADH-dependent reductase (Old Yellow Enzyme family)
MTSVPTALAQPLRLPCGAVLLNRLCKSAMTEGIADPWLRATDRHERLYRRWSHGGAGLLITGNVQIDRRVLERPGNVAIDVTDPVSVSPEARLRLARWAEAGTSGGNQLWMQIAHAGRQSPRYVTREPLGPSRVQLDVLGGYAAPRALTEAEILDFINRFARVAGIARECGFTGVQLHGAHGYLLSSFLSPVTNRRTDAWGGTLENRARMLLEAVRAARRTVGADFPLAVKLNSDDFRTGGFGIDECLEVVGLLNREDLDLLEVSGGTYEQPRLLGMEGDPASVRPVRESTRAREAYFLDYAARIRTVARMPLMVTGGFRTRAGMEAAVTAGDCDLIGLARPLCLDPDFPRRLLSGEVTEAAAVEKTLVLRERGVLSPSSPLLLLRLLNVLGAQGWYYHQIFRLADGLDPDRNRGVVRSIVGHFADELRAARRVHRARRAARTPATDHPSTGPRAADARRSCRP